MSWRASLAGSLIVVAAGFGVGVGIGGKTKTKTVTRAAAATTGAGTTTGGGTTTAGRAATTYLMNVSKVDGDTPKKGVTNIGGNQFPNSVWYAEGEGAGCSNDPTCSTSYALRGRDTAFESFVGVKEMDSSAQFEFDVVVDGVTVCAKKVSGGDQAVPVRVSVADGRQLTLKAVDQNFTGRTPVWGNAALLASGDAPPRCS